MRDFDAIHDENTRAAPRAVPGERRWLNMQWDPDAPAPCNEQFVLTLFGDCCDKQPHGSTGVDRWRAWS